MNVSSSQADQLVGVSLAGGQESRHDAATFGDLSGQPFMAINTNVDQDVVRWSGWIFLHKALLPREPRPGSADFSAKPQPKPGGFSNRARHYLHRTKLSGFGCGFAALSSLCLRGSS